MGHPKPFNMKFIGIGNEQWGEEYFTRLELFMKAIQMKYPEITIVTSAGPFAEGEHFDLANKELKRLNAKLVDEHYYKNPEWFLKNADRYDSYDRNSYKIFAGEYAAQSVSTGSPDNKNNWQCALAEAAFLTGIERNADVVHLSSYAPLFAHTEAWQWTPDLIWFDNLSSYGTPNYYVQKMFSNNKGTTLISVTSQGKIAKGQNDLYVSAVKDDKSKEVIVKIVNSGQTEQTVKVLVDGVRLGTSGTLIQLASNNLEEVNSIEQPNRLAPTETSIKTKGKNVETKVPPYSFSVIKLKVL
jgi:alpha-N-arabinofuranosidase